MRQVTHALLTRPPLSHLKWINLQQAVSIFGRGASFDLHVLSTPPAFILSQDQTLMLKFVLLRNSLGIYLFYRQCLSRLIFCLFKTFFELNRVLVSFLSNVLVRKIIFIIFQGCFTVQLSRFLQSVFVSKALSFRAKPIVFIASALLFLYRVSKYYLIR